MKNAIRPSVSITVMLLAFTTSSPGEQPVPTAELLEKENKVQAAKAAGAWTPASVGLALAVGDRVRTGEFSRAAVRLTDLSVLRLDELTKIEITTPVNETAKPGLDLSNGAMYFFSREKPRELEIKTPAATGALRGTEFQVRVEANGRTRVTMFDGEVELANAAGRLLLRTGEQGEVEVGQAPHKTAMLEAVNIIQWCLYYPGVLDVRELGLSLAEEKHFGDSLTAYRAGDLLGALEKLPANGAAETANPRLYRAAVLLAVGRVDRAQVALAGVPGKHPGRQALAQMIAAVKNQGWTRTGEPTTAGESMAESYYQQAHANLEAALKAAQKAVEISPTFGFAWARMAELEFSFGRTPRASKDIEHSLELAPRNAQAHALQGFLLAAENRLGAARRSFDTAIELDGALGNAWLGRGLCLIRHGDDAAGRRDLQTAAVLEPNRSILRSYLGKALSQSGNLAKAHREFDRAKELDPNDPTPWLYSALTKKDENRINESVRDLETSVALNDHRSVYRSRLLLDEDAAVRSANLASIYERAGLTDVSLREASEAVTTDYGNPSAHLFLANSYNALRDPRQSSRYDTPWFNELLISNLLSPVGGGPLSQFVSEQEYSKLFEADRTGLSSETTYYSTGDLRETASAFALAGNFSIGVDTDYRYSNGLRPNSEFSSQETFAQFKWQFTPQDTLFFQTSIYDFESGDLFPRYDQGDIGRETSSEVRDLNTGKLHKVVTKNVPALTTDFRDRGEPGLLLAGLHHTWQPGVDTILLASRVSSRQTLGADDTNQVIVTREPQPGESAPDGGFFAKIAPDAPVLRLNTYPFDLRYRLAFEINSIELNHVWQNEKQVLVVGSRYQTGTFRPTAALFNAGSINFAGIFAPIPADDAFDAGFERVSLYAYETWKVTPTLALTGGVTYDRKNYPGGFVTFPLVQEEIAIEKTSPKAGLVWKPFANLTVRAAYTESLGGQGFDQDVRLEPARVAGFNQSYSGLIAGSLTGPLAAPTYKTTGFSVTQKLNSGMYWGVDGQRFEGETTRFVGAFAFPTGFPFAFDADHPLVRPSRLVVEDNYQEDSIAISLNQLLGDRWAFGARYQYTRSKFEEEVPAYIDALNRAGDDAVNDLARNARQTVKGNLQELKLSIVYNHPCGFFSHIEANWYGQENDTLTPAGTAYHADGTYTGVGRARALRASTNSGPAGDAFWQFNLEAGYRFPNNHGELSVGLLNATGQDYQLAPVNYHEELARDRTVFFRCKINF